MQTLQPKESLAANLAALRHSRRQSAIWDASYLEILATLSGQGFCDQVLPEGAVFPDFMLPNAEGRLISLATARRGGPVIVAFFRGEWCPFCRLMLASLTKALPEIEASGATLLALSPETGGLTLKMKQFHGARFEILADVDCGVGLSAGVIFRIPPLYRRQLESGTLNFPDRHGNTAWCLPVPATFVLSAAGTIVWRFLDVDYTNRPDPADIIAAVRGLGRPS